MNARRLGAWSALAVSATGVVYAVVLAIGFARHGLDEPIADPILAWMEVLTVLAALPLVPLLASIRHLSSEDREAHAQTALAFATLCVGTTTVVHFVELTAARQLGGGGIVWPSGTYAAELLAWNLLLGVALLFAAPVLDGHVSGDPVRERSVRRGLTLCGLLCVVGTAGPAVGSMRLQLVGVVGYALVLPVVCLLLARLLSGPRGGATG